MQEEHGASILVVEDDGDVRDTVSAMLENTGFEVETSATGHEAMQHLDNKDFDLLVTDIGLPDGLSGIDVVRHARHRQPELRCLFISGAWTPVVCDPELDDFIAKPFRLTDLVGCVMKVLHGNIPYPRLDIAR